MPLAFAAIGLGVLYLISGFKGQSLSAVFRGEASSSSLDPAGGAPETIAFFGSGSGTGSGGGSSAPSAGASTTSPGGTQMFDGKPVANWIVPILKWARNDAPHRWHGKVNSGYRTAAEQQAAATNYGLQHYGAGGPQASNHRGTAYPRGAVDVSDAAGLARALKDYKGSPTLVWAGPTIGDWVHFSANGH